MKTTTTFAATPATFADAPACASEPTIGSDHFAQLERMLHVEERSAATLEKYLRNSRQFARWLGSRPLTREEVTDWREELVMLGFAATTVNCKLSSVAALMRAIGRSDCRAQALKVQQRAFRDPKRHLTREEYCRLVTAALRKGRERIALIMETICSCGIRVSELHYITMQAIRCGQAEIRLKGKLRIVLLPKKLCCKLLDYARRQGIECGALFVTRTGSELSRRQIWGEMKALSAEADVPAEKVFPHNLRHLFACEFYNIDRDLAKLADVLGHSSIETTRRYLMTTGDEHLRLLDGMNLVSWPDGETGDGWRDGLQTAASLSCAAAVIERGGAIAERDPMACLDAFDPRQQLLDLLAAVRDVVDVCESRLVSWENPAWDEGGEGGVWAAANAPGDVLSCGHASSRARRTCNR